MKVTLKSGIGKLLFGMKENDVQGLYGKPDSVYKDEDKNIIYLYNAQKLRLTFYADEDFRLGYIIGSGGELELFNMRPIGSSWAEVEKAAAASGIKKLEKETIDSVDSYFNEDNWVLFQVEFGEVVKVEVGAIINNKDEFDWKFAG